MGAKASKYKQLASAGVDRAQSKLNLTGLKQGLRKKSIISKKVFDELEDAIYVQSLEKQRKDLYRKKYDDVINHPSYSKLNLETPDFDHWFKGEGGFKSPDGGQSWGLNDVNVFLSVRDAIKGDSKDNTILGMLGPLLDDKEGDD